MSEELTTTPARALLALARRAPAQRRPAPALVPITAEPVAGAVNAPTRQLP